MASALTLPAATALAVRADGQVFGPGDPSAEEVDAFWREVDAAIGELRGATTFWGRTRARLSLRSLKGEGRMSERIQELKDAAAARVRREPGNIDKNRTTSESETP
jgi:hypothetical protein